MKGNTMLTLIAILAIVSVPFVLDVYFNAPHDSEPAEEEYIPDGR
jgi:hypothetical protein